DTAATAATEPGDAPNRPAEGEPAPDFSLPTQAGDHPIRLSDFRGKQAVVLYFYPKDDTPGCTAEACSFRDHEADLTKEHAVVLGVSIDPLPSHEKFTAKHNLNFPLLSDETADVAKMYGVWKEKNLYGRRSWGVARTTFWIGPDRRIRKIYKKVDTARHAEDILTDLRGAHAK
ncbi:MAG TPA: thioredoxin-dependent thiol peroxidase, partial [Thermoanaerobaculia bacterium]